MKVRNLPWFRYSPWGANSTLFYPRYI